MLFATYRGSSLSLYAVAVRSASARRLTFIWEQQHAYLPPFCLHKSINLAQFASQAVASFSALHLLKHCKLYAAHPTALPAGPDADAASFLASHPQHFFGSSALTSVFAHAQQSAFGG